MKAEIEVDFENEKRAGKALEVLRSGSASTKQPKEDEEFEPEEAQRAAVSWKRTGKRVTALVRAKDYAALRARATSVLRDFKIVTDSIALITRKK